jgi:hypothetical protein
MTVLDEIQSTIWVPLVEGDQVAVLAEVDGGTLVVCTLGDIWTTEIGLVLAKRICASHNVLRGTPADEIRSIAEARQAAADFTAHMRGAR